MKQSQLFGKTLKENPKDEVSKNAILLERGGFIYKNSAGVYSFLPLGWRVIQKIASIIREEMNAIGGQEMFMAALHDKRYLQATGRWNVDVVFKVIEEDSKEPSFNISWTHEEIIAEISTKYISSYKDMPFAAYQIQTKFRNEPRAKSGLLRGREFLMKDLYSFHTSEEDLYRYYAVVGDAYKKIFERCGMKAYYVLAGGGDFTINNTHEFQVASDIGEDTIFVCEKCEYAENKEVSTYKDGDVCAKCGGNIQEKKSIEVGNIFPLGIKYSKAFDLHFIDAEGKKQYVVMGSYGIGLGRLMAVAVELFHDDHGIIWPESLAPFRAHLVGLGENGRAEAEKLYADLLKQHIEVLYDDRVESSAGQKFADADLIGIPYRIVVSDKTLAEKSAEIKKRSEKETRLVSMSAIGEALK